MNKEYKIWLKSHTFVVLSFFLSGKVTIDHTLCTQTKMFPNIGLTKWKFRLCNRIGEKTNYCKHFFLNVYLMSNYLPLLSLSKANLVSEKHIFSISIKILAGIFQPSLQGRISAPFSMTITLFLFPICCYEFPNRYRAHVY